MGTPGTHGVFECVGWHRRGTWDIEQPHAVGAGRLEAWRAMELGDSVCKELARVRHSIFREAGSRTRSGRESGPRRSRRQTTRQAPVVPRERVRPGSWPGGAGELAGLRLQLPAHTKQEVSHKKHVELLHLHLLLHVDI